MNHNTLADKNIIVLEPYVEQGGRALADIVELLVTLHGPVGSVRGITLEELPSLRGEGDVIVNMDSIRSDGSYIGDPHQIVDLVRARTHQSIPLILQVFGGNESPFVQAVPERKNALTFSHSYPIGSAIRRALGLPMIN